MKWDFIGFLPVLSKWETLNELEFFIELSVHIWVIYRSLICAFGFRSNLQQVRRRKRKLCFFVSRKHLGVIQNACCRSKFIELSTAFFQHLDPIVWGNHRTRNLPTISTFKSMPGWKWGTLTPLQYGLTVNLITKQVNSDAVFEGRGDGLWFLESLGRWDGWKERWSDLRLWEEQPEQSREMVQD